MSGEISTNAGSVTRRSIVAMFVAGMSWIGALLLIPVTRLAIFPLRNRNSQAGWSDVGTVESLVHSRTPVVKSVNVERRDGWQVSTGQQSVYVVAGNSGESPRVLSAVCPHLGCTVQWVPEQDHFNCPCHGGVYAPDGSRVAGPPNRGMDELPARIQDGHLYVQFHLYRQLLATQEIAD